MKTMKTLLAVFGLLTLANLAHAYDPTDAIKATTVDVASMTIFSGQGKLYKITLATGNGQNYAIAYDTATIDLAPVSAMVTSTHQLTPALIFSSATIVANGNGNAGLSNNGWAIGEGKFVTVQNGLWIFKTAANSGEANKVTVYWSR